MAQLRQKENNDRHRKPDPNWMPGDKIWLNTRNIRTTRQSKKLDNKKAGPFTILANIGKSSYKLELPPSMKIHSTFHTSAKISLCIRYAWCIGCQGRRGRKSQFWMEGSAHLSSGRLQYASGRIRCHPPKDKRLGCHPQ